MRKRVVFAWMGITVGLLLGLGGCMGKAFSVDPGLPDSEAVPLPAKSAVLMAIDQNPPAVLYRFADSERIAPASMTKLVTAWLLYRHCAAHSVPLTTVVSVPPAADYRRFPSDSSLFFLTAGSPVSLETLLSGLMVASGNDAAVAVALFVSETVEAFVQSMNGLCRSVLSEWVEEPVTHFSEPSGYSADNRTTALEFAYLLRAIVADCAGPEAPQPNLLHFTAQPEMQYAGVLQHNHNELVGRFEGIVGLKTGFIHDSGANVALLAQRGETRLAAVLMGIPGESTYQRSLNRSTAGAALLSWGFARYAEWTPVYRQRIPVAGGGEAVDGFAKVQLAGAEKLLLPTVQLSRIRLRVLVPKRLSAARGKRLRVGDWVGLWRVTLSGGGRLAGGAVVVAQVQTAERPERAEF